MEYLWLLMVLTKEKLYKLVKFKWINKAQFDHKNGKNWDSYLRICQALHVDCHDAKSRNATKKRTTTKKKKTNGSKPVKIGDFTF